MSVIAGLYIRNEMGNIQYSFIISDQKFSPNKGKKFSGISISDNSVGQTTFLVPFQILLLGSSQKIEETLEEMHEIQKLLC